MILALVRIRTLAVARARCPRPHQRGVEELVRRHDAVHQSDRERFARLDAPSREHEVAGDAAANEIAERAVHHVAERVLDVREERHSEATRRSHSTARSKPPASAAPFTAATTGNGNRSTVWWKRSLESHSRR